MRPLLSSVTDGVRARLWPIPTIALAVTIVAGVLVSKLDRRVDTRLPGWLDHAVFNGDAGAAQTVLDAVASSLVTVTSLTFSLTVVTLQLASSQFSPRLLRTFTRDLFVQATLALFLGTFAYAITMLRVVRSSGDREIGFVPRIGVTVGYLLVIASVFMLVVFLAHLTQTIRVETMLRTVHEEASSTAEATLRPHRGGSTPSPADLEIPDDAELVVALESGFVVRIDDDELVQAALEADAIVRVETHPGGFVVDRVPFARAWARGGGRLEPDVHDRLAHRLGSALKVGYERTAAQDIGFGLRQLTDVANKALSPGINDPTTAIHALGHISSLLCDLGDRQLGPRALRDEDDAVRVVVDEPDFASLVDEAITQPRRYGASDPQVMARIFRLLGDLACRVPPDLHPVVRDHLRRLEATVGGGDLGPEEIAALEKLGDRVRRDLSRGPTS